MPLSALSLLCGRLIDCLPLPSFSSPLGTQVKGAIPRSKHQNHLGTCLKCKVWPLLQVTQIETGVGLGPTELPGDTPSDEGEQECRRWQGWGELFCSPYLVGLCPLPTEGDYCWVSFSAQPLCPTWNSIFSLRLRV